MRAIFHTPWHEGELALWNRLQKALGVEGDTIVYGAVTMNDTNAAIQAAITGQGVVLVGEPLVRNELESGRLVVPFEVAPTIEYSNCSVYRAETIKRPPAKAFLDWILEPARSGNRIESQGAPAELSVSNPRIGPGFLDPKAGRPAIDRKFVLSRLAARAGTDLGQ